MPFPCSLDPFPMNCNHTPLQELCCTSRGLDLPQGWRFGRDKSDVPDWMTNKPTDNASVEQKYDADEL